MARLIPADKGTHIFLGALATLALLPIGWPWAVAGCALVAIGREVYGRVQRRRPMERADWIEAGLDINATLVGGGLVLAGAFIGVRH